MILNQYLLSSGQIDRHVKDVGLQRPRISTFFNVISTTVDDWGVAYRPGDL